MRLETPATALAALLLLGGCRGEALPTTLPDSVHGVWTSDEPRFEGRFLELRADYLIIANGEDLPNKHKILEVESREDGAYSIFRVTYVSAEGERALLSFYHTTFPREVLELANQRRFQWTKQGGDES